MAALDVTSKDQERFARARKQGQIRAEDASAVLDAHYDAGRDVIDIEFRGGGSMAIPRRIVPALKEACPACLEPINISPAGDALSWPSLDIDVYVPGLVERAFGTRLFAAATGRRGGKKRSEAKAAAARDNGAKGGRPPHRRRVR